jgi:hypothetical protein
VTDDGDDVRVLDREVATPVLISKPRSTEWGDVRPELIDCTRLATKALWSKQLTHGQTSGCSLAHAESARTRLLEKTSTRPGARRKVFLDEVDDCIAISIRKRCVREQLTYRRRLFRSS